MALEQPMITSVIARMDNATIQLAAFGVAFSMALFIEGSIIQMLAAGTAISNSRENYRRLLMLMHIIGITATAIHAALCIPGVFYPLASVILGLPEELISPSRRAFLIMLPWTIAVGYRRLWQGVLIHYGRTRVIPISMTIRILFLITALRLSLSTGWFSGAAAGAIGLLAGVSTGALATWFYVRPVINRMPSIMNGNGGEVIRWDTLIKFYVPLALTSFINLGIRPVMQMGMSRGAFPLESLAIWPVFMGYMFLYNSLSLASQEVVIAQIGGSVSNRKLIRFISGLAVTLIAVYLIVLITPLWRVWHGKITHMEHGLAAMSRLPTMLALPVIPLSAFISLYRGSLIRQRRTREVTYGVLVNAAILVSALFTGIKLLPCPSISITALSYSLAHAAEFFFLASLRPLEAAAMPTHS